MTRDAVRDGTPIRQRWVLVPLLFLFVATAAPRPADAVDSSNLTDQRAVESARENLSGYNEYPWYDTERDAVRRIDVEPPADVASRKSKWETPPPANWNWPDWLSHLAEAFGWLLLAAAVLLVVYALFRALGSGDWRSNTGGAEGDDFSSRGDIDRVESLPFQLAQPNADLLAEARRLYELGDFNQAIVYLYSYQLIRLDRHQLLRLAKGKTNRQYLRELRTHRDVADLLRDSMVAFEEAFFGHHRLSREVFERCWSRLDEFHQRLEPVSV